MKILTLCGLLLFLGGCSKQVTVCMELGENANVHGEFGYFYDSASVDLNGPAKFRRLGDEMLHDPCSGVEA